VKRGRQGAQLQLKEVAMASQGRGLTRLLVIALLLASSLQFAPPTKAKTFTVCPSGCNFTTIAAALEAAGDRDEITIREGVYTGGFVIEKNVTLRGAGRDRTTIQGTSAASVIRVGTTANVDIRNVTITGGGGSRTRFDAKGGGGILNEGELILADSTVRDNAAANGLGGGIYSSSSKNFRIFNSNISDNRAQTGGGIFIREGDVFIANSNISRNQSESDGGGIRHDGGETLRIEDSIIGDNRAGRIGGGVAVRGALQVLRGTVTGNRALFGGGLASGNKRLNVIGGEISDNDAGDGLGGGILVGDGGAGIQDVRIRGNKSGSGAGIHSVAGDVRLASSTVSLNVALDDGGGIFNQRANVTMFSSEVVDNQAGERGGGIFVGRGGSLRLGDTLNTIRGNQPDQCFGATC
jgi:hypothetical protein